MHLRFIFRVCILCCLLLVSESKKRPKSFTEKFIGDKNYTKIIKDYTMADDFTALMAILFTNKNCETCSNFEPQLFQIEKALHKQKIEIFRCDISANRQLSEKFQIKRFPQIHFVYAVKPKANLEDIYIKTYKTTQILTLSEIVETAKYLRKALIFDESKNLGYFFVETLSEIPAKNRMILNIQKMVQVYGIKDKQFIKNMVLDQNFNSMPLVPLSAQLFQFYLIDNQLDLQMSKNKSQTMIIISVQQSQGQPFIHTTIDKREIDRLFGLKLDLKSILKSFLFYATHQFTESLYVFHQQLSIDENKQIPIYLAVVDSIWNRAQALEHINMLNKILNTFSNEVLIFWLEGQINPEKKVLLGFDKNTKPPMFGELILAKNQPRKPLKNLLNQKPLFGGSEIKKYIRNNLGYERLLIQKIKSVVQQLGLTKMIQIKSQVKTDQQSAEIVLAYCTSELMKVDQIDQLSFLIKRFQKFYPLSNLNILTELCLINDNVLDDGLYVSFKGQSVLLSQQLVPCTQLEIEILQVTARFASLINRKQLFPKNFCILEYQMRDFLIKSAS